MLMVALLFLDLSPLISTSLFKIQTAHAAAGDFSIFRNAGDNTGIPNGGTPVQVSWDTIVTENANIDLLPGGTTIDLIEGGKYLVLYNVWAEDAIAGTNNRRSFETYLTVNGSELAYGRGDGYIRDANEDDKFAYASGGAIIGVNAGDDLVINIARDDTNTDNNIDIRAGVNGVSIVKMRDDFDYVRLQKLTRSANISGDTTFAPVTWDTTDELDASSFSFTPTSENITLQGELGQYFMTNINVRIHQDANSSARQNYEMRLTLDGVEVPGTRVSTYPRGGASGNGIFFGTLAYSGLVRKTSASSQTLNVEVRRESAGTGANTDIVGGETAISIAALPTYARFLSVVSTTTQPLANTQAPVDFDEQLEVDSTAFSHSTTINPSRINFDLAGNYLLFSNIYTSRTTGTDRDPVRVDWRLDGATTIPYGGHGSFNRGDQGTDDAFTSGSTGGLILNGVLDTQYVEVTAFDEEDASQSSIPAGGAAIQIVEMSSLFQTDIEVSATGTQIANTDIVSTDVYSGGAFVIKENTTSRNLTTINLTENGTVDGSQGLSNIKLFYDLDTSAPYDCSSESYSGGESQFGSTDTNGFSGADGISSFTSSVAVTPTQSICIYPVYDVTEAATDGQTIELSINNPVTDLVFTDAPSVSPATSESLSGSTELQNAELTQTHYQWLNDDGVEGSASSMVGTEDTPASGFSNGTVKRVRLQVSAEGSTSSAPVQLRLEYGAKVTTCDAVSTWTDVGAVGGDWDMSDSTFITDGNDSSDLLPVNGGTTNENTTHLPSNGALRDTSSQLGSLTFASTNFLETEFAIEPTVSAPQGTSYCFRVSDAGTDLRNYSTYPEATISADVFVSSFGTQTATLDAATPDQYVGGSFIFTRDVVSNRNITEITITENGSIDALTDINNVKLYYETAVDCTLQIYDGTEVQYGTTDTDGFSAPNGSSTFTGSVGISAGTELCVYVVLDIVGVVSNGQTVDIQITNPSTEVVASGGSTIAPNTTVELAGVTTISSAVLTQIHYHWRNDDGNETGATSASGGVEDTAITEVPLLSPRRLRLQVSNEGTVTSDAVTYRLEYGTKISTCSAVGVWTDVGEVGGAWDMVLSANIADGNTTDIPLGTNGATTNENTTFVGTGALRETTSETSAITLTSTGFTELEYSIEATVDAGYATDYCFRVTNAGTAIDDYQTYAELTTRKKQDFFIQRGELVIAGTTTTLVAGIDYTAPSGTSTAFVRLTNNNYTGSGNDAAATIQQADDVTAYIEDQSDLTSSFTISRPPAASSNTRVAWEIIEFIGLAGTDNEMKVRDVGEVYLAINSFFATSSPITSVSNDDNVAVFITGHINYSGSTNFYNDGLTTSEWASSTGEAVFQRADEDADVFVSYAVVEFTGINWAVQRVEHQYTAAGSPEVVAIESIPSATKGFVHAQKRAGEAEQGLDEFGHQVFISSLGALTFQLRSGVTTPSAHVSVAWVISNSQSGDGQMSVYQSSGTNFSGSSQTSTSISFVAEPGVDTTNASIFGNHDTAGTGTAYPRAIHSFFLASSTAFEIWRSEAGQPTDYRVEIVEWPVADTGIRQNYYRFYTDNDALEPTDPWPVGAANLGENTSISSTDEPLGEAERVRIRMSLRITNSNLPQGVTAFKLQYGLRTATCSGISSWSDVGAAGSGEIWRGFDATPVDGTEVATSTPATGVLKLSLSDVAGTYEEENPSAINPYAVQIGDDVEYDWLIEHNGAAQRSDYCFRMVEADGTPLDGYINYPTLRTTGYTPVINDWRWYDDELNITPTTPLASENTAPVDVANTDVVKLRTVVSEVESASGVNVKFALQFSQYSDFSDGGEFVTSTSSCTASSTWCYSDAAGVDNDTIPSSVISSADSCVAAVGTGCGTHNETPDDASTKNQPANSNMEFEFTIEQVNPRVNSVYYFRLYDVGAGDPVLASSSYPSVVTAGPTLVFGIAGVDANQSIAGIVTDATTTATAIPFGAMTFGTDYKAAQQISVDTNATQGYQILMYSTQQLTNTYGDEIPAITSSNDSPAGWLVACTGAEIGCFGYHTTDATLFGASSRFSPTDSYAALSTTAEEIMFSSIPAVDSHEIVYRVQVSEIQPAGDYETEIVYIAVPVF